MNKKILLVVPRLNIGGAETYVASLALGLKKIGFTVHVASAGGCLSKALIKQGIEHHFVPIRLNAYLAAYLLTRIVKRYGIDIIHANSAAAGIAAVKAKEQVSIPVVYTAHGVFGHNDKERSLSKCDHLICVSKFVQDYAAERGMPNEKMSVIYTGINLDNFQPNAEIRRQVREKLNIDQAAFTLAIVARIKNLQNKGHGDILKIFQENKQSQSWHLLIIGKGRSLGKIKSLIKEYGLTDRIHCLGHQTAVGYYLNAADAVVLPSQLETFGLVLAEGMAMAKPAVAYRVGGTAEVISDKETGFLVPYGDVAGLSAKLTELAEDPVLCKSMGSKARKYVQEHFSYKKMLDKTVSIYQRVLQ